MWFRACLTCSPLNCFYVCLAPEAAPRILINPPEFYLNSGENDENKEKHKDNENRCVQNE